MRQSRIVALCLVLLMALFASVVTAQEATEAPEPEATEVAIEATEVVIETDEVEVTTEDTQETTYVVQPGDNLFRIALRNNISTNALAAANNIANPRLIYVGQQLTIPDQNAPQQPEPTPPMDETYTVRPGDNLYRIAVRYGTTIGRLLEVNAIPNPNVIFVGQELAIPGDTEANIDIPATRDEPLEVGTQPQAVVQADPGFDYGIEAFYVGQDPQAVAELINDLGLNWAKIQVDWRDLEPVEGQIDYTELDALINEMDAGGLDILLTLTSAPTWARETSNETGPPTDLSDFTEFVTGIVQRYAGTVDAYQIWDEPNLRRSWRCGETRGEARLCETDYMDMLQQSYTAVKATDPNAIVVSAGLAPTRWNDRVNAINDQIYLATLYANGLAEFSDAIGANPGGAANPPDAECCEQPIGVETHFEDSSFFFLNNLQAYRQIMVDAGDAETPIWVTRFGWGTNEDLDADLSPERVFIAYTSLNEQAIYDARAFELGEELGYVGAMFLDNLNGCVATVPGVRRQEVCYYSMVNPNGEPRPVFNAIQNLDTPGIPAEETPISPEPDAEATEPAETTG